MTSSELFIPVFPLPNVVLFPRILLPLYIFEPRYRIMLSDVLDRHGKIAMALIRPGSPAAAGQAPEIFPIVGVGQVVSYETQEDGTSHIMLLGEDRARIDEWDDTRIYRQATLEPLVERDPPSHHRRDLLRDRLKRWLDALTSTRSGAADDLETSDEPEEPKEIYGVDELRKIFARRKDLGFLVDFLAHHFLEDPVEKQDLLEELDVEVRATELHRLLQSRNLV